MFTHTAPRESIMASSSNRAVETQPGFGGMVIKKITPKQEAYIKKHNLLQVPDDGKVHLSGQEKIEYPPDVVELSHPDEPSKKKEMIAKAKEAEGLEGYGEAPVAVGTKVVRSPISPDIHHPSQYTRRRHIPPSVAAEFSDRNVDPESYYLYTRPRPGLFGGNTLAHRVDHTMEPTGNPAQHVESTKTLKRAVIDGMIADNKEDGEPDEKRKRVVQQEGQTEQNEAIPNNSTTHDEADTDMMEGEGEGEGEELQEGDERREVNEQQHDLDNFGFRFDDC